MICISIGSNDFNFCCQVIENYEFVEIRMDLCNFSEFQYKQLFQKTKKAIATFSKNEIEIDSYEYNLLFKSMDYGAKIIDINYNWNIEVKEKLIQYAKSNKVEIICSYHNFDLTPSKYDLLHIIENINAYKIDFIKMATFVNNRVDAARLISLYEFNFPNLLIVGMGELGKIVRIASMKLGVPFMFASIDNSQQTAPGQININDLSTIIKLI